MSNRATFVTRQVDAVRNLWRAEELVRGLTARNLRLKYKGSALGFVWVLVSPVLTVAVLSVVFTRVVRVPLENFWAFLLSGFFVWRFMTQTLASSTSVLPSHGSLSRAAAFPKDAPIMAAALSRLVEFAIELTWVLVAIAAIHHGRIPPSFIVLPWLVVLQFLMALGFGFAIATLSAFYRDVDHAIPVALTALFYLTPVFYPISLVPETIRPFFLLNPFAWLLELYHSAVYWGQMPTASALLIASAAATGIFALGYGIFNRYSPIFAEVV
jgi:ABC-2 type transport system permease protein